MLERPRKAAFKDYDHHQEKGGLASMGETLKARHGAVRLHLGRLCHPTWPGSMRPSLPAKIPKKGAVFEDPLDQKGIVVKSGWEVLGDIYQVYIQYIYIVPVVPHKAGGRSFKDRKPIGEVGLWWITDGRANPLMDQNVVGVVFFGVVAMVAVVTSPQLLDVVWCSAVVAVVVV